MSPAAIASCVYSIPPSCTQETLESEAFKMIPHLRAMRANAARKKCRLISQVAHAQRMQSLKAVGCLRLTSTRRSRISLCAWEKRRTFKHGRRNTREIPGADSCETSGTTMSMPVKSHLSPGCASSTHSPRTITSTLQTSEVPSNVH